MDKFRKVPKAAKAFAHVVNYPHAFPQRSLVCPSMGNFLLRRLARALAEQGRDETGFGKQRARDNPTQLSPVETDYCFDDIFMVAADVSDRSFDKRQNNNRDPTKNAGLCIIRLVKHNVHVLHSRKDKAMWVKVIPILGSCGLGLWGYNKVHVDAAAKLLVMNCDDWNITDCIGHKNFFEDGPLQ